MNLLIVCDVGRSLPYLADFKIQNFNPSKFLNQQKCLVSLRCRVSESYVQLARLGEKERRQHPKPSPAKTPWALVQGGRRYGGVWKTAAHAVSWPKALLSPRLKKISVTLPILRLSLFCTKNARHVFDKMIDN